VGDAHVLAHALAVAQAEASERFGVQDLDVVEQDRP
jgi:hypothetical protein